MAFHWELGQVSRFVPNFLVLCLENDSCVLTDYERTECNCIFTQILIFFKRNLKDFTTKISSVTICCIIIPFLQLSPALIKGIFTYEYQSIVAIVKQTKAAWIWKLLKESVWGNLYFGLCEH